MDLTDKMDISLTPKKRRIETKLEGMDQSIVVVTSITDLNTKCLVNIFSLLKLSDLASMAMTCKSFNRVARKVFAKEHQEKLLEIDVKDSLVKSVEILRCFQNQIKKLSICYISNVKVNPKIDVFVNKYCGESLTEMRFKEVGLYSSVRAYIKPFSNVTSLVIQSGIISGKLAEIVTLFPSVTSLEIHGGVQHGGIKDNAAIPSLRHLTISFNPDLGLDHFKKVLVKSNPQLTSLDIHYVGEATTAHLLFLRDSLPNLQRLMLTLTNICVNKEPFKPLLFKELRFLRISCQDSVVLKSIIIKSIHSLERLELSVEGNINVHCVNFIMRHQSKEVRLTLTKLNDRHLAQLGSILWAESKNIELIVRMELSATRGGLMKFVAECEKLENVRIEQPNMVSLAPIIVSIQGTDQSIWNKE